jgi:peroxiredoxin Q/BCP
MLKIGDKAPDFNLLDQNGESHQLSDFSGKWIFLYFYPKDDTPGCTTEACSVRDNFQVLKNKGVEVLGVSVDSVKSHKKFEQKYDLNFTLLADEDKEVVEKYEVWGEKQMMGKKYMGTFRTSFLINPKGEIAKIYEKVDPKKHLTEVLEDLNFFI